MGTSVSPCPPLGALSLCVDDGSEAAEQLVKRRVLAAVEVGAEVGARSQARVARTRAVRGAWGTRSMTRGWVAASIWGVSARGVVQ